MQLMANTIPSALPISQIQLIGATITLRCRFCKESFQTLENKPDLALMELVNNINRHMSMRHPQNLEPVQKKMVQCIGILGTIASIGHLTYIANTELDDPKLTEMEQKFIDQVDEELTCVEEFMEEFYLANKIEDEEDEEGELEDDTGNDGNGDEEDTRLIHMKEQANIPSTYDDPVTGINIVSSPRLPLVGSVAPQDNPPTLTLAGSNVGSNAGSQAESNANSILLIGPSFSGL